MWSEKTRLPVRGRRPRMGSLVFNATSRLEEWFVILYHITGRTPDLKCIFGNHLKLGLSRPEAQVCGSNTDTSGLWSNTETPGLEFKQWHPRSPVQIPRPQVCRSNTETQGLRVKYRDPRSAFHELQTWGLNIWTPDLGSQYLSCRPRVSLFELQTWGVTVWTAALGSVPIPLPQKLYKTSLVQF